MKPLDILYWTRACLGVVAGALCALLGLFNPLYNNFLYGLSLALLVYMVTNYFLRQIFIGKVEKARKVLTTGIVAYFLIWIVTWVLLFSAMYIPTP